MRTFVAIPVPDAVRARAVALQKELSRAAPGMGVRWVRADQMHLTLKFLGELDPARLEALVAATRSACAGCSAIRLEAIGTGFFPDERRPRVLWLGLGGEVEALQRLQASIETTVRAFAESQEDRPFSPHLTLARIKSIRPGEARALVAKLKDLRAGSLGAWQASQVEVLSSELRAEGSRYTCLAAIPVSSVLPDSSEGIAEAQAGAAAEQQGN
jgi:RNA 2',3'-cyclic 3'-phosphodiesterase